MPLDIANDIITSLNSFGGKVSSSTGLVDKKLVHKEEEKNVLIYNLRRALLKRIDPETMEKTVLHSLNEEEKAFLLRFYSKEKYLFVTPERNKESDDYMLMILPQEIDEDVFEALINPCDLVYSDLKYLLRYFYRDKNKFYLIEDEIDEEDELKILKIFNLKGWYITSNEKSKISDILEKVKDLEKENVFFCNMHARVDHDFFFEHSADHVPALMTIEAARQFLISVCHRYFNVPLEGYSFVLEGMKTNFISYLELNYPISMKGFVNDVKMRKEILSFLDISITIWQKSREIATIDFIGKVIKARVFKELRKEKTIYKLVPRFSPRAFFCNNVFIKRDDKMEYFCDLIDLSENGFRVKFNDRYPENITGKNYFEFFMFFQELDVIHGNCTVKWMRFEDNFAISGLKITGISDAAKETMNEALKRFCYVKEDREIV